MKRFILAIIASVILGLVTTRCSSFSTRAAKEDESKEDVVIPRISEAEPSELKSPFQGNGDAVERTFFEDSWSLERIVSGNASIFEEDLSAEVPLSPSIHEESTNPTLVNRQTDQLPSAPSNSDSLRDILKGRADQIRRKVEGIEKKKSGSNDFYEDSFSPVSFIKCTVLRGGKFKSGDRITLRALQSASMGGIAVTKHDLIEGYCTVEDRVQITVHTVNGRAVNIKGFDMDGMEGLWYSDQSTEGLSSLSDEIVRDGSSLLSARVGRIARGIASAGVETISRRRHSIAVEIPSGYELLLGYKQQQ